MWIVSVMVGILHTVTGVFGRICQAAPIFKRRIGSRNASGGAATRDNPLLGNHPVLWRDEPLASLKEMRHVDLQSAMLFQPLE